MSSTRGVNATQCNPVSGSRVCSLSFTWAPWTSGQARRCTECLPARAQVTAFSVLRHICTLMVELPTVIPSTGW